MQALDINPFPTHVSGNGAIPPDTNDTDIQQGSEQPHINQVDIGGRHYGRADTKPEPPPSANLEYAKDACSATIASATQNSLEGGLNFILATPVRPEMGAFTTEELVVELKQRMQEEGRWNRDESLPGYPESDQGISHCRIGFLTTYDATLGKCNSA
ncbi:hypothetical protein AAF712_012120 [Marasmius tenuissimus]|uniref:Uncharacterized protein n=1 Tax=Marasmius tenuissimus TaxID=585030 RepID=A0ABR2ZI69_9AGAR